MHRWILFAVLIIFFNSASANDFAAEIKHAETTIQNDYYLLATDLEYHLSPQAKEALQNGVPLFWSIKVKLQQRSILWNKTLLKRLLRYRLQYHALLNMYRVRNENTGIVNSFSTLSAALNSMSTVRDLPLIASNDLFPDEHYVVAIKILFENDELPLPLQTQVIANSQWQLSSEWTYWDLLN